MSTTIDDALDILEGSGPEYTGGLSNHGPMAADALIALGRADAVTPWVENYKIKLLPAPRGVNSVSRENWREALGDINRVTDWISFFDRELAEAPWREVLDRWVGRLAPGAMSAAMHCLIRTGHAVRGLAALETDQRLHELAEGLGYWGASYMVLPGAPANSSRGTTASRAIHRIKRLPEPQDVHGSITDGLARLDTFHDFDDVIDLVDTASDPSSFISDLTETFAAIYLANAGDLISTIVFIHGLTGPSAIRLLAPHLSRETLRSVLGFGWQAAAALYAVYGRAPGADDFAEQSEDTERLIDRAVASGDEHAIKFTEACLRERELNPKPVYIAAARHAVDRFSMLAES
ncbi:MAG TPA: questin oxidase family protein [Blastocatellia bacterium]|nr:questin oxidase family protein [Blastocatellia bacterium]